jgi:hypothetical protein
MRFGWGRLEVSDGVSEDVDSSNCKRLRKILDLFVELLELGLSDGLINPLHVSIRRLSVGDSVEA